jgi:hypothetical protein
MLLKRYPCQYIQQILTSILISVSMAGVGASNAATAILKNESLQATIQSGMLISLKQVATGDELLSAHQDNALGKFLIWGPGSLPPINDSAVDQQAIDSSVATHITAHDGSDLEIQWKIEPGNGDLILNVSSKTPKPVDQIRFLFSGCDIVHHTAVWIDNYGVGRTFNAPWTGQEIGDPQTGQPAQSFVQPLLVLFEGQSSGWLIEGREPNIGPANVMMRGNGPSLDIGMVRCYPTPSAQPSLFEIRIRAYQGHWEDAVDPYVRWMESGAGFIPLKSHSPSWVGDIKNQAYIRIGDFDGLENLAARLDPKRTLVGRMVGAWIHPMDVGYPDYTLADSAAQWIHRARELGFHVGVHFNTNGISKDFPDLIQRFRGGLLVTGKDADGNDTYFGIEGAHRHLYCSCAYKPWRDYLISRMKPAVDAGVDLIYLDESLTPSGKFLVDGVTAIQGVMLLEREIKQAYPQAAVETEQFNPMNAHNADFSLSQMPLGHPLSGYIYHRFLNVVAEGVNSEPVDDPLMDAQESWGFMLPPAAKEESWLQIAKAFEQYNLVPDSRLPRTEFLRYDSHYTGGLVPAEDMSPSNDSVTRLFGFRGDDGVTAFYAKQGNKRGFVISKPNEPPQWIATRISGVSSWPGPGILCDWVPEVGLYSDWLIYNGQTMLSLNPAKSYLLRSTATLDQNRFHLTSVPPDFSPYMNPTTRVRGQDVGRNGNWFRINFTGHGECTAYVPDNCRAFLNGRELDVDRASHTARFAVSADADSPSAVVAFYRTSTPLVGKWVDLPWETPPDQRSWYVARHLLDDYSPDGPVRMIKDGDGFFNHVGGAAVILGQFPQAAQIRLQGAYCMRDDSQSTTGDGVVRINGKEVFRVKPGGRPFQIRSFDVDVSSFAGQNVILEFGSEGQVFGPTMADWFHPQILVGAGTESAQAK